MSAPKMKARTGEMFRAAHDKDVIIPNKMRAALAAIAKIGPEHFVYDEEFRQLCGCQGAELAAYRDLPEFRKHWFMTPGQGKGKGKNEKRIWWPTAKAAAKYRPKVQSLTG